MKRIALFVSTMIVAAACASASPADTNADTPSAPTTVASSSLDSASNPSDTSEAPDTSGPPQEEPSGDGDNTVAPKPEGPIAPDFTLALADGESFTLYDEQKPVYMIFWAEW